MRANIAAAVAEQKNWRLEITACTLLN